MKYQIVSTDNSGGTDSITITTSVTTNESGVALTASDFITKYSRFNLYYF